MRLLFSAVPAFGHILPLVSLMEAAVAARHDVALLTSAGIREEISPELPPEVSFLAAGRMPGEFSDEAARRTGADVFRPTPVVIGEIFGGARVDLGAEQSVEQAQQWAADLVLAEAWDVIGPMVAARSGIGWHQVGVGPAVPAVIVGELARAAASRYEAGRLCPTAATSYLDPCPPLLQDSNWSSPVPVRPLRTRAHRRPRAVAGLPVFADPGRPTVLVTLGTVFSDPKVLAATVDVVASHEVNVLATLGSALSLGAARSGPQPTRRDAAMDGPRHGGADVRHVPFVPLSQLLDTADLVVTGGGAGTMMGALACGVPMVLWPQGADQPLNADRAAAAGVAITVQDLAEIPTAMTQVLAKDSTYRLRAQAAAAEITARPSAAEVIEVIAGEARGVSGLRGRTSNDRFGTGGYQA